MGERLYTPLTAGRQLDTVTMDDGDYFKYYYNENGFLEKAVMYESDGIPKGIKQFIWDGDKLIAQNLVEDDVHTFVRTIYDADDEAIGLIFRQYDNETDTGEQIWLYRKNLQGDVTGVIDGFTGALIGSFTYDAYGMPGFHPVNDNQFSILSSAFTFVMLPQIYRGYTYFLVGNEICYYLDSRFYSPRMGRFLNADKYTDTGTGVIGTNMFAYCNNNPVMNIDPSGEAWYKFANISTNWFVIFLNKLVGASIPTDGKKIVSINSKNIKVALTVKCITEWNPDAFYTIDKKGNLSCKLGGIDFSCNNGKTAVSTSFTYKKTTISAAVKLGKKDVTLCIGVNHNCYYKNNTKINVELELAFSISYTMLAGMAATVVAVSVLKPVLIPAFTKTAIAIKSLVSAPAGLSAALLPVIKVLT